MLADHLLKLGGRTLAFAVRSHSALSVSVRIAGAREAILHKRLSIPPGFVHEGDPDDVSFAAGFTGKGKGDAILCANDDLAALLVRSLNRTDVREPADIRVVGFDDVRYARMLSVPLTTMHQPCRELAVAALRAMLDRIADPSIPARSLTLSTNLDVRESWGAYLGPLKP